MQKDAAIQLKATLEAVSDLAPQTMKFDQQPIMIDDGGAEDWDRDGNRWGVGWSVQHGWVLILWSQDGYSWFGPDGIGFDPDDSVCKCGARFKTDAEMRIQHGACCLGL